jgi:hypothetical protein
MTSSKQIHNTLQRLSFYDTALVDCAVSYMMAADWDCVIVPSLFVIKAARKQWFQKNGPSILPKMVTYVHPMTYTQPCALDQKPVSLAQGMAWCLDFFQNYFSENPISQPMDLAGFARSLLHLWEHIDRMVLYDHPDPAASALWENQGVLLPSVLQSGYLSGTPQVVQEWLKWWPQWLYRHNLCSQTRATYLAQNHALTFWSNHPHHKILLCVQNVEKLPTHWLKGLMSLPNVWTLFPKDVELGERLGVQIDCVGGLYPAETRGPVSNIMCAHESESARVVAILIQEALQNGTDVGLIAPCSTLLQRVSCALKIHDIHLPTPHQSLVNTLLQSIWRGCLGGWPLSEVLVVLRHPLILKAYPIVGAVTRFIEQHRPKWPGIGGHDADVPIDGMPRWLKRLHRRFNDAFGWLTSHCQIHSVKQPMAFWMDGHIQALDHILPVSVWDHDDVVEKMLQEGSNDLPHLDAVTYGQWFKAWTSTLVHMDQKKDIAGHQEGGAEDRIMVGTAEDLGALHLGRCIVAVAEPLPKFPWMPKSWQAHFHLCQDGQNQAIENHCAEVFLVSVHSNAPQSMYRYRAEHHWKNALLPNVVVPVSAVKRPYPPLHRVSISDVQRWHTDPEAFYQERVLRIRENTISEPQAWGLAMHVLLDHFLRDFPVSLGFSVPELFDGLCALADVFLPEMPWWKWSARRKLLYSIAECEHAHRQRGIKKSLTEQSGHLTFSLPQGSITLFGRADRIDYLDDGTAHIIDYKTGVTPSFVSLDRMESVQLPLEGYMVQSGAMGPVMPVSTLSWWSLHLTHGCRIKTYPRCVSALLDRYGGVVPIWMEQLVSGGYGDFPVKTD